MKSLVNIIQQVASVVAIVPSSVVTANGNDNNKINEREFNDEAAKSISEDNKILYLKTIDDLKRIDYKEVNLALNTKFTTQNEYTEYILKKTKVNEHYSTVKRNLTTRKYWNTIRNYSSSETKKLRDFIESIEEITKHFENQYENAVNSEKALIGLQWFSILLSFVPIPGISLITVPTSILCGVAGAAVANDKEEALKLSLKAQKMATAHSKFVIDVLMHNSGSQDDELYLKYLTLDHLRLLRNYRYEVQQYKKIYEMMNSIIEELESKNYVDDRGNYYYGRYS